MLTGAKMPTPNICVALLNATAFFSVSLSSCRTGMKMIPPAIGAPDAGMAAATIARKGVYLSNELRWHALRPTMRRPLSTAPQERNIWRMAAR